MICGSEGYTGAAYLSAQSAVRSGAGMVFLGVPNRIYPILAQKLNEPVVFPLADDDGGRISLHAMMRW
jgi:NAD(P)H-hydrate epimerase